jgi:hypothetical protein
MITSAEEFVALRTSDDSDEYTRAAWEDAPTHVWLEVIEKHPDMRAWVAHNKSIPESIIRILAVDSEWRVRITIARKRKTPPDILETLAKDSDESIRHAVAFNRKTPAWILEMVLNDEWINVRETAKERRAEIENKRKKTSDGT